MIKISYSSILRFNSAVIGCLVIYRRGSRFNINIYNYRCDLLIKYDQVSKWNFKKKSVVTGNVVSYTLKFVSENVEFDL
jgi:hypothetical protein